MICLVRRRVIALALPAIAVGLTACGSSVTVQPHATTTTAPASAAATTTTSSAAAPSSTDSVFTVGQQVTANRLNAMSDAAIKHAGTVHVKMAMAGSMTADADMKFVGHTPEVTMKMSAMGEDLSMILTGGSLYLKAPTFGTKYIKIDPNGTDALSKQMGAAIKQMSSFNGLGNVGDSVKWTVTSVDAQGATLTTKLTEADLRAAAAAGGASDLPSGSLPGSFDITMAYDAQDRPAKAVVAMGGKDYVTMTMSQWGQPVSITAPPSSDVTTAPKSLGSLGA